MAGRGRVRTEGDCMACVGLFVCLQRGNGSKHGHPSTCHPAASSVAQPRRPSHACPWYGRM
eukprot:130610-Chlamydomonas_euryale.AAC.1